MNKYQKKIKTLNFMRDIQGEDGNYNYDSYMLGLYNGVEFASAIMEDREPNFRSGKDIEFLHEKTSKCIEIPNDDFEDIEEVTYKPRKIQNTINSLINNQKKIINILKNK